MQLLLFFDRITSVAQKGNLASELASIQPFFGRNATCLSFRFFELFVENWPIFSLFMPLGAVSAPCHLQSLNHFHHEVTVLDR